MERVRASRFEEWDQRREGGREGGRDGWRATDLLVLGEPAAKLVLLVELLRHANEAVPAARPPAPAPVGDERIRRLAQVPARLEAPEGCPAWSMRADSLAAPIVEVSVLLAFVLIFASLLLLLLLLVFVLFAVFLLLLFLVVLAFLGFGLLVLQFSKR